MSGLVFGLNGTPDICAVMLGLFGASEIGVNWEGGIAFRFLLVNAKTVW